MTPLTVCGVAIAARPDVNRSMPPLWSITPIRTLTPQTIMITDQGTARTVSTSSAIASTINTDAAMNADRPGF
jgi:hypothetical protein